MLIDVRRRGESRPMILHTFALVSELGMKAVLLVGFDGTAVSGLVRRSFGSTLLGCVRVAKDDGEGLPPNTAGDLKKRLSVIMRVTSGYTDILMCVGDQPLMRPGPICRLVDTHIRTRAKASILLVRPERDSRSMSDSSPVDISQSGEIRFSAGQPERTYQPCHRLVDAGVLIVRRSVLPHLTAEAAPTDVFGKLTSYLPQSAVNPVVVSDSTQFVNVNSLPDLARARSADALHESCRLQSVATGFAVRVEE
jgi:NDP-sugar pyrophosphorylase family protein